jgi:hypothetical protein
VRLEHGACRRSAARPLAQGPAATAAGRWCRFCGIWDRRALRVRRRPASGGSGLDGPGGPDRDFTDLHAWAEAYLPGAGWIGFDATSGLMAGEGHIPVACTAVPASAAPVFGFTDVCETQFGFEMTVTRIHEDPRVTKPYSELQWNEIDTLGRQVEDELAQGDVAHHGWSRRSAPPTIWTARVELRGPGKDGRACRRTAARLAIWPGASLHYVRGGTGRTAAALGIGAFKTDGLPLWRDQAPGRGRRLRLAHRRAGSLGC